MVAKKLRSGEVIRLWQDKLRQSGGPAANNKQICSLLDGLNGVLIEMAADTVDTLRVAVEWGAESFFDRRQSMSAASDRC